MKKQNKAELSVLLQLPGYVFWKDSKGRFTGCNNAFAEFLGLDPEEIMGKNDREISDVLGVTFACTQNKIVDGQGQVHDILSRQKPLYDDRGRIAGTIELFITTE